MISKWANEVKDLIIQCWLLKKSDSKNSVFLLFWEETAVDEAVREYCCKQLDSQQMKIVAKPNCGDDNTTMGHELEQAQTSPNDSK